jgi:transposase-like protein
LRLLKAADAAVASGERGALQALLRREGIYSSHLTKWRQQYGAHGTEGLKAQKPGRKPKLDDKDRQLQALTKRNAELERKLYIANALIGLQKKAHEILGIALPESDDES